jgi:thioredoxin reductase/Pyruvate/2-oxoacid:ferredoxin oxidoreductase delta subunit
MDTLITFIVGGLIALFFLRGYFKDAKKRDAEAKAAEEKGKQFSQGPQAQFPHIDTTYCIGCATCTLVCPEGDVLAMLGGKAVIVNGHKCIGHSLCAEACPVGAITMVMSKAGVGADMPTLSAEFETTVSSMFIVGELGGLALIKNAVNQGRDCVDVILNRFTARGTARTLPDVYDVLIVGAGPAGIAASLRAIQHKLKYITLDRDEIGGTVAKYPRQKLVMTSPVEFPLYGKFKKTELSKEDLLAFWDKVLHRADFKVRTGQKVDDIKKGEDGIFTVITPSEQFRAHAVILALGRTGTPRKLGVKGEDLSKVMYRLIEADHYINKKILVVGGGDSAVEAAMGLANQVGNKVTISYRQAQFGRIKERNTQRVADCIKSGKLEALFNSSPVEFKEESVIMDVQGQQREIPNDFVWIFAGGIPPNDFLKKIGVGFGAKDMTQEGSKEAKQAAAGAQALADEAKQAAVAKPARADEAKKPLAAAVVSLGKDNLVPSQLGIPGEDLPKVAYLLDDAAKYEDQDILVVGGGDTAIQAAIALSHGARNRVTLSYRGDQFQRGPGRHREFIETADRGKKVRILRHCSVTAITPDSVIVEVDGRPAEIPNDHVFILIDSDASAEFQPQVAERNLQPASTQT